MTEEEIDDTPQMGVDLIKIKTEKEIEKIDAEIKALKRHPSFTPGYVTPILGFLVILLTTIITCNNGLFDIKRDKLENQKVLLQIDIDKFEKRKDTIETQIQSLSFKKDSMFNENEELKLKRDSLTIKITLYEKHVNELEVIAKRLSQNITERDKTLGDLVFQKQYLENTINDMKENLKQTLHSQKMFNELQNRKRENDWDRFNEEKRNLEKKIQRLEELLKDCQGL